MRTPGSDEKTVMNFGKISPMKIGKMTFDLWDFILPDNFSPLWNNFVRGSDVFILVMESTAEGVKAAGQFLNLHQREAKNARIAVICNKQDVEGALDPDVIKEQLGGVPTFPFCALDELVKDHMLEILERVLDLKKPLPSEFKQIIVVANQAIAQKDFEHAIENLKQASIIAKEYQEMGFYQTLEEKITQMETNLAEKKVADEREQKKIKAPEKVVFTQKIIVKELPVKPRTTPLDNAPAPVPVAKAVSMPAKSKSKNIHTPAAARGTQVGQNSKPTANEESIDIPEVPEPPAKLGTSVFSPLPKSPDSPKKQTRLKTLPKRIVVPFSKSPPRQTESNNQLSEVDDLALRFSEILRDLGGVFELAVPYVRRKNVGKMGRAPTESELMKAAEALAAHL